MIHHIPGYKPLKLYQGLSYTWFRIRALCRAGWGSDLPNSAFNEFFNELLRRGILVHMDSQPYKGRTETRYFAVDQPLSRAVE